MNYTSYVKAVCKLGQGEARCCYLSFGAVGLHCSKLTAKGIAISEAAHEKGFKGDNCPGMQASLNLANEESPSEGSIFSIMLKNTNQQICPHSQSTHESTSLGK